MQYQVPQFIETEDKVVGPFSLRQFIFVGIACFISALFYFFVATWLFFIVAVILVGGALALSFVTVEGRPLLTILLSAINFYWKPQTYIWQSEQPVLSAGQVVASRAGKKEAPKESYGKGGLSLEGILSGIAQKTKWIQAERVQSAAKPATLESIAAGSSLHKSWQSVQTGETAKTSDRQFIEREMDERYHIFRKLSGAREAARRVDYR